MYACPPGEGSPCQFDGPRQQNHWQHGHILLGNAAALTTDRNPARLAVDKRRRQSQHSGSAASLRVRHMVASAQGNGLSSDLQEKSVPCHGQPQ